MGEEVSLRLPMKDYRLIGIELSPYTIKLRAIMRYRRIPHIWICRFPQFFAETQDLRPGLMPTVQYPEGTYHTDSTVICEDLENRHPSTRSVYPDNSVMKFLALLIEDFSDEWLSKMIFHYRFSYSRDRVFGPRWVMDDTYIGLSENELDVHFERFLERQTKRMELVGCTPKNAKLLEKGFEEMVCLMESFVANERFLFGSRPSIADFSLYAQLGILLQDITPGNIMRKEAPRTISWLMRAGDLSGIEGDWELKDEPSPVLKGLFAMIGKVYLPYLNANTTAIRNDCPNFSTRLDGCDYEQPAFKYHNKCRDALISKYQELNLAERKRLRSFLGDSGCLEALGRLHQL